MMDANTRTTYVMDVMPSASGEVCMMDANPGTTCMMDVMPSASGGDAR
jgi:hypothetical protein